MIPLFKPSYGEEELNALREPFTSGWIGLGPKTKEFEEKFARYLGVRHAVAVNSATAALHLALHVAGVQRREVITTSMTFVSTNHAILYNEGIPVFCDIEADTCNMDAAGIEGLITPRTRAVMVVHYGGYAADMETIMNVARRHNLTVVEDAAHAAGGEAFGKKLGAIGDLGCFSFHAVKNLACGEGGMITTNNSSVDARLRKLRWMGITKDTFSREDKTTHAYSWYYDVVELGYKCHMNDIPAALGIVQLGKLDNKNARRADIVARYNRELTGVGDILTPATKPYMTKPAYHNYVIRTSRRDALHEFLKEKGISTGVHYYPNHLYEMYAPFARPLPVTERVWKSLLTLPLFPDLTDEQVGTIIGAIKEFYSR